MFPHIGSLRTAVTVPSLAARTASPASARMSMPLWVRQSPSVSFFTSISPLNGVMAAPLTGSSREKPEESCGSLGSAQVCEEGCCASEELSCEEGCEDACADGSSSGASAVICSCCDWVEGELAPSDCALGVSAAGCFFAGSYGCSCFSCGFSAIGAGSTLWMVLSTATQAAAPAPARHTARAR